MRSLSVLILGLIASVGVVASPLIRAAEPPADIVSQPLSPEDSLKSIVVPEGFVVELMAAEPLVVDPVAFAWGGDGKFWVVEMNDYPLGIDGQGKPGGKVKFLVDENGDGRFDRATVFVDGLKFPTSVLPWRNGAIICALPEIFYAEDVDGDGRAEKRDSLFTGLVVGNPQHLANGLRYGLDGWVHCANGATKTAVRSVKTGREVDVGTRDFRIRPDTGEIETLAGRSQYLRETDDWGNWFGNSNSNPLYHFVLEEQYLRRNPHAVYPAVQRDVSEVPGASQVFPISRTVTRFNDLSRANRFTSACSATIYRDTLLGEEFYGNSFVCEPVHNLVHREIVERDGVSFKSHRPASEKRSEFLASSDNWFRPSMVRTGPDGCLWISDMYRLVIEHPEWIPKDWQAKLDLRAGSDKGRIYRVRPAKIEPSPVPRLDELDAAGLVKQLDNRSGTHRDLAMQRIVERCTGHEQRTLETGRAADALIRTARDGALPQTRLHALCTLAALDDELDTYVIRGALIDAHPEVRRWAARFVTPERIALDKDLLPALAASLDLRMPAVHHQVLMQLGAIDDRRAYEALARFAAQATDPYLRAAVSSSLTKENVGKVAAALPSNHFEKTVGARRDFVATLVDAAAAVDNYQAFGVIFKAATCEPNPDGLQLVDQAEAAVEVFEGLRRHGKSLEKVRGAAPEEVRRKIDDFRKAVERCRDASRLNATQEYLGPKQIGVFGRDEAYAAVELEILAKFLTPKFTDRTKEAVIAALGRMNDPNAQAMLLGNWRTLGPTLQGQVLDLCLARPAWTEKLFDEIGAGRIRSSEIDVTRTQQLLSHSNAKLRERAVKALAAGIATDRQKVVDEYLKQATQAGDVVRGREVFAKSCGNCHKLGETGNAVGPDLAALSDKSPKSLVTSILDPNRAVESKYVSYTAETDEGLSFTGLLVGEGEGSITLALPDGKRQTVLRTQLESFASNAKSFMPEGLEKDLSPDKLADVLAFVGSTRPVRKTFDGNAPRVVKPEALRGEFYLLAPDASIYGDTLVFEPKFTNLGYWKSANDRAEWELEVVKAGDYDVTLEYACPPANGGTFVVESGGERLAGSVESTGSWERYSSKPIGTIRFAAGKQTVVVRTEGSPRAALFDLKSVRLKPR
jgi:putative membrane-bound dehydrogenase-like protein